MQLGKIAYEAYANKAGGRSLVSGDNLPPWDNLPESIQEAWEAGAQAVRMYLAGSGPSASS
jgi:hypothetical protein